MKYSIIQLQNSFKKVLLYKLGLHLKNNEPTAIEEVRGGVLSANKIKKTEEKEEDKKKSFTLEKQDKVPKEKKKKCC